MSVSTERNRDAGSRPADRRRRPRARGAAALLCLVAVAVVLVPGRAAAVDESKRTLSITFAGSGSGHVDGEGGGCTSSCTADVTTGTQVSLTATANDGSVFMGWSGDCSGTDPGCSVTMDADRSVTATFGFSLTVSVAGSGTVTGDAGGIDCGSSCSAAFAGGEAVTLTATPAEGSTFTGWSGDCSGTDATCTVAVDRARTAQATFAAAGVPLTVTLSGDGHGSVASDPAGISCGGTCSASFAPGTSVTLTAAPAGDSSFAGWGGDAPAACGTAATCVVTTDTAKTVTATFASPQALSVVVTGSGTVASDPAGIDCGATCTARFAPGTSVTLTATAAADATFAGWSGACTGTAPTCTVTAGSGPQAVGATFTKGRFTVSVVPAGQGLGTVTSSPAGIDCGRVCAFPFDGGATVTLTATPAAGSTFTGWGGDCDGTGTTCTLAVTANRNVTATFAGQVTSIAVTPSGTGSGRVTSLPAGIDCGSLCTAPFTPGGSVTLTAVPATGSVFAGWSGACSGSSTTCVVGAAAGKKTEVGAVFNRGTFALTVTRLGTGGGRIASSPPGIDCGVVCSAGFAGPTNVTLTATPDGSSTFAGWSGACSGTAATCTVSVQGSLAATATFTKSTATVVGTKPTTKPVAKKVAFRARLLKVTTTGKKGKRRLLLRMTLTTPARADVSVRKAGRLLGKARVRLKAGSRQLVVLLPKRAQRGKLSLRIVLVGAGGKHVTLTRGITLR